VVPEGLNDIETLLRAKRVSESPMELVPEGGATYSDGASLAPPFTLRVPPVLPLVAIKVAGTTGFRERSVLMLHPTGTTNVRCAH